MQQELRGDTVYNVREQLKSGYLNRQQLVFVYRVTCAMRGRIHFLLFSRNDGRWDNSDDDCDDSWFNRGGSKLD